MPLQIFEVPLKTHHSSKRIWRFFFPQASAQEASESEKKRSAISRALRFMDIEKNHPRLHPEGNFVKLIVKIPHPSDNWLGKRRAFTWRIVSRRVFQEKLSPSRRQSGYEKGRCACALFIPFFLFLVPRHFTSFASARE